MEEELLAKYTYYIEAIQKEISRIFESQKEYICCAEGCSYCCESGMYPFSQLEFEYIKLAFDNLEENVKQVVVDNLRELEKEYIKNNKEHFMHKCPFLINGSCSVYNNRGIICRTFGVLTENSDGNLTLPSCMKKGLNYSKVYDPVNKGIDEKKVEALGYLNPPKHYNLSRKNMMSLSIAKNLELYFGESRMLIEWFFDLINGKYEN